MLGEDELELSGQVGSMKMAVSELCRHELSLLPSFDFDISLILHILISFHFIFFKFYANLSCLLSCNISLPLFSPLAFSPPSPHLPIFLHYSLLSFFTQLDMHMGPITCINFQICHTPYFLKSISIYHAL